MSYLKSNWEKLERKHLFVATQNIKKESQALGYQIYCYFSAYLNN